VRLLVPLEVSNIMLFNSLAAGSGSLLVTPVLNKPVDNIVIAVTSLLEFVESVSD
jgi:hypothetical protein